MDQEDHIMNIGEGSICFSGAKSPENDDGASLSLLYNLSTIQEKVHQIQSLVSLIMISTENSNQSSGSTSLTMANIGSLVQEIITAASSMMFTCQQLHGTSSSNNNNRIDEDQASAAMVREFSGQEINSDHDFMRESTNFLGVQERGEISFPDQNLDWYGTETLTPRKEHSRFKPRSTNYEILELDAADLLEKYTHYCQICGKGFKRDANLRMHMRAHGDEYKTREALINPTSHEKKVEYSLKKHYYSCPQQGCRWNQRHEKFQPLKSMICAKNHYKRSHCPKMYMCRKCSVKHFSVLSDLRTHEKHCGDIKWVCSCGTRFSRKDKLLSHVSLFFGHSPINGPSQLHPPMINP